MMLKKGLLVVLFLFSNSLLAGATSWHDFEIVNGLPIIDVEISGVPAKAALSTGSNTIFINVDFLKKNKIKYKKGKKIMVSGTYGKPIEDRLVRGIDLKVLGTQFSLNGSGPSYGEAPYDALLGFSFFKSYVFQVDYPNSRIRALTRDSVNLNDISNLETDFADQKTGLIALTKLQNGESLRLKINTSLESGVLLDRSFVERQGWLERYEVLDVKGDPTHQQLILPELKIGPYPLLDVVVNFPSQSTQSNISANSGRAEIGKLIRKNESYSGLLGYDVLKHFLITLDAKTGKVHLFAE